MSASEAEELARLLSDSTRRVTPAAFPRPTDRATEPGLYAWFADAAGAAALSRGLATRIVPGLVYAGEAGAGSSAASLSSRIRRNHLGGNIYGSTFRFTLAAVLARELGLQPAGGKALATDGEERLSRWMRDHLTVAIAPLPERARLGMLEDQVLSRLDPPLNLEGMPRSPVRAALSAMRKSLLRTGSAELPTAPPVPRRIPPRPSPPARLTGVPPAGPAPDVAAHLDGLVGRTIPTMTGRPNRILAVEGARVLVGTGRSPEGAAVGIADIQVAANRLYAEGSIDISVESVGHRSAFIGAVLATLPGALVELRPRRILLDTFPGAEVAPT